MPCLHLFGNSLAFIDPGRIDERQTVSEEMEARHVSGIFRNASLDFRASIREITDPGSERSLELRPRREESIAHTGRTRRSAHPQAERFIPSRYKHAAPVDPVNQSRLKGME